MSSKEKEQEGGSNCISVAALYLVHVPPSTFTALEPADRQVQVPVPRWCAVKGKRTKKRNK